VAQCGQVFEDRAVARLLPSESATLGEIARGIGIGVATPERWRSDALANSAH